MAAILIAEDDDNVRQFVARALEHQGHSVTLAEDGGLTAECAGRAQDAEDAWRRCVYLDPEHYEALCTLALLAEQRGDLAQGAGLRERAARVHARRGRQHA